jgi:hypothetical protein
MVTLNLCTPECCIQVESVNENWCRCKLVQQNKEIYLGAETPEYLTMNLLAGLDDSAKQIVGWIDHYEVSGVVALAEAHHVLFAPQT